MALVFTCTTLGQLAKVLQIAPTDCMFSPSPPRAHPLTPLSLSLFLSLVAVSMSQSPWTYSAPMELPLTRSLNSSSSESSIDSGFESPLCKSESVVSPLSAVSAGSFQDAISTSCAVTNMLVSKRWRPVVLRGCMLVCAVCMARWAGVWEGSLEVCSLGLYSLSTGLGCVLEHIQ